MYRPFIERTLEVSADIARSNFGKVTGVTKEGDNNQVLTETDLTIGRQIIKAVQAAYPDHNIIDEEAGVIDKNSAFTWVIDPIDGTSNFASGIPMYGIMLGLLHKDTPIAGGIALPSFHEMIIAEKGNGAFCNGQEITVTQEKSLSNCLVAYGIDGHQEDPFLTQEECRTLADIVLNIRSLRNSGSAFDYIAVARGKYGGVLNKTSKIWDNVTPHIIIEEAGGIYTDYYGQPIDYTDPLKKVDLNYTCCGASTDLHPRLMKITNTGDTAQ